MSTLDFPVLYIVRRIAAILVIHAAQLPDARAAESTEADASLSAEDSTQPSEPTTPPVALEQSQPAALQPAAVPPKLSLLQRLALRGQQDLASKRGAADSALAQAEGRDLPSGNVERDSAGQPTANAADGDEGSTWDAFVAHQHSGQLMPLQQAPAAGVAPACLSTFISSPITRHLQHDWLRSSAIVVACSLLCCPAAAKCMQTPLSLMCAPVLITCDSYPGHQAPQLNTCT